MQVVFLGWPVKLFGPGAFENCPRGVIVIAVSSVDVVLAKL